MQGCGVNRYARQAEEVGHAHLPLWRSRLHFIPPHVMDVG